MGTDIRVLRLLVASPGDCSEERTHIADTIERWNRQVGRLSDVRLEAQLWEFDTFPDQSAPAQEIINRQIVDNADWVIAVFWHRLGTPTEAAESGTAEEIQRFIRSGKPALLYFSQRPIDPSLVDPAQISALRAYRKKMEKNGLVASFSSAVDLRDRVERDIGLVLRAKVNHTGVEGLRQELRAYTPARTQQHAAKSAEAKDYDRVFDVSQAAAFYDEVAELYDARQSDSLLDSQYRVISRLSNFLSQRGRRSVLDLGGGTGEEIATHFAHRSDLKWYYVDESGPMLRRFNHSMRRSEMTVTPILGDAREQVASMAEDGRRFDAIIISWLFSSLPANIPFSELSTLLAPGGRLIIADAHPENLAMYPFYGIMTRDRKVALRLRAVPPGELVSTAATAGLWAVDSSDVVVKADGVPYAFVHEFMHAKPADSGATRS